MNMKAELAKSLDKYYDELKAAVCEWNQCSADVPDPTARLNERLDAVRVSFEKDLAERERGIRLAIDPEFARQEWAARTRSRLAEGERFLGQETLTRVLLCALDDLTAETRRAAFLRVVEGLSLDALQDVRKRAFLTEDIEKLQWLHEGIFGSMSRSEEERFQKQLRCDIEDLKNRKLTPEQKRLKETLVLIGQHRELFDYSLERAKGAHDYVDLRGDGAQ